MDTENTLVIQRLKISDPPRGEKPIGQNPIKLLENGDIKNNMEFRSVKKKKE
jgi:hypothetical protein